MGCRIRLKRFLLAAIIFFSVESWANRYAVYEHIVISQDITVSAHRLCQDGVYIYFLSKKQCQKTEGLFDCEKGLRIAPISFVEKVFTELGSQKSITQFFKIKTQYSYQEFDISRGYTDKLLSIHSETLPFCMSRPKQEAVTIGDWRYASNQKEKNLVESLFRSNLTLVNTPFGNMASLKNLPSDSYLNPWREEPAAELKTPFCNKTVSENQIWKLSGEYTGNGVRGFEIQKLQDISSRVYIERIDYSIDSKTRREKRSYQFTCNPTWDI